MAVTSSTLGATTLNVIVGLLGSPKSSMMPWLSIDTVSKRPRRAYLTMAREAFDDARESKCRLSNIQDHVVDDQP